MAIGSYLVFNGILLSARLVARDTELRKEFYNNAMSQLSLLKTIGVTEMENELIKKYKFIESRTTSLEAKETRQEDELYIENVREILHDVVTELYEKSRTNNKPDV